MKKIAISLTAHESELALLDQCFNYIVVGNVDFLVIHINPLSDFDTTLFMMLVNASPIKKHIYLNSFSTSVPIKLKDSRCNPTLHRAHLSNFQFLRALTDFDIFCLDASNSLLVRLGLRDILEHQEHLTSNCPLSPSWPWTPFVQKDAAFGYFKEYLNISQHEGTSFTFEHFSAMYNICIGYEMALSDSMGQGRDFQIYPREEVVMSSAYKTLYPDLYTAAPYIYMPWERNLVWQPDMVNDVLLGNTTNLPKGRFGIKRVARDINDPIRTMIGNHFGYRAKVYTTISDLRAAYSA